MQLDNVVVLLVRCRIVVGARKLKEGAPEGTTDGGKWEPTLSRLSRGVLLRGHLGFQEKVY